MANSLKKSVENVIDTLRGRRESAAAPTKTPEATLPEAATKGQADVPQLHLASTATEDSEKA